MKLYIVHVGFYDYEIGIYELHSNMLVAAPDAESAKQIVKNKESFINKSMHIDGIQEVINVDGYDVKLSQSNDTSQINKTYGYNESKNL